MNSFWNKHQIYFVILVLFAIFEGTFTFVQNLGPSNQPEAYFNGSSYLRLQTTISLKKQTALSFRTCTGGTLFSQQQNDNLIQLTVTNEGVVFTVKNQDNKYEEKILGNFLNNKWHIVSLQYKLGNLTIQVDEEIKIIANSSYRSELLTTAGLYNEGATVLLIGNQFNGCLLEGPSLVFNASIITSSHNVIFGDCPIPEDSCTPKEQIKIQDFCMNEPCMRHGNCINGETDYTCQCSPRYSGKNCEIDIGHICDRNPAVCHNGGTCEVIPPDDYECQCPPNYTGQHCESQIVAKCLPNTCINNGTCVINDGNTECLCPLGFAGNKCETNLDECTPQSCRNGGVCHDGVNNFTCECVNQGYTGMFCESDVNECLGHPCLNHGTCFNYYGSYMCQCLPGYEGTDCENSLNECMSQPCQNHGVCLDHPDGYKCNCPQGFAGEFCEIEEDKSPCDCLQFGECSDSGTCACKSEYIGVYPNCTIDVLCSKLPCKNGGTCSSRNGSFTCSCPPGFRGPACEWVDIDNNNNCNTSAICQNGGTCTYNNTSTLLQQRLISYHCVCPDEWTSTKCDVQIKCSDKPCFHAIACQDYLGGYYCQCEPGWTGTTCNVQLGSCSNNPCLNGATCYDQVDFYFCRCRNGFQGKVCQTKLDGCASMPCLNDGICIDQINGFSCNCTDDWMGTQCELPYDVCAYKPCSNNGTCVSSPINKHEFQCNCLPGFEGGNCEINIDHCVGVKCSFGKKCVSLINEYECRCPPGYGGENCTLELDPCAKQPCSHGATCQLDKNTLATCICSPGFTGETCEIDIDECANQPGICNEGICVNKVGGFQCYCKPGYTGERCNLDFDECLSTPCKNNATCHNQINNYECECTPGYEGKDCSVNIDECEPEPCMNGSTCHDLINDFSCTCIPGLTGKTCDINIDDCESSPCLHNATCIDGLNSYSCDCSDTGYTGEHCEENIDDCIGNPCANGAQCVDLVKKYRCDCYDGYEGVNCEEDIDECLDSPCKYDGICLEKSNKTLYASDLIVSELQKPIPHFFDKPFDYATAAGYECVCVEGIVGVNCEINIDECESSPCLHGLCEDKVGGFSCKCDEGYEGDLCNIDIDECEKYKPCAHGKCVDKTANYLCECEQNFGGKNCSVQLAGCAKNPCLNEGSCKPYLVNETIHKFNCSCPNGFHGDTCEKISTMSLSGNSLIAINTSRDEGYDIQFRFKTTLSDGLLALGKGPTYYILELSKGRLNLHSSLLNKWEGVFIGSNLNDSNWQRVFVAINSTHLVLSANDEQTIYPITFNDNTYNSTFTTFPLTYIGGIPSNLKKLTHGQPFLVGCTEDVLINGEWVLPEDNQVSWANFQNVDVGCVREPQCDPNPCHSDGHCTDLWRNFSCTCGRPYLGHTCQYNYTAATFGYENITDSLVTVSVADFARRAVRTIVDISMFIRTRQTRGQIFYLGSNSGQVDDTYIAAQLEAGELLVRIQFNGTPESYTVGGVKLDNGYNHLIEVVRNVTLVQVKLNGTEYFRKTISATGTLDAQVLILGGPPQSSRYVRQANENLIKLDPVLPTASAAISTPLSKIHFKGIIQDVQISNGSSIMVAEFFPLQVDNLFIPQSFGEVQFNQSTVLEGIYSDDLCKTNPCSNNGTCENTWNDYKCNCKPGFKGKNCTDLEFCQLEGCPGESTCQNLENGYECIANATFDGRNSPVLQYKFFGNSSKVLNLLELTYRTRSWGTLLYAKLNKDYFAVFINHNDVVIEWSMNAKAERIRFRREHFEGQWLSLYIYYHDGLFRGGFKDNVIDEMPNFEIPNFDFQSFTNILNAGDIYIGGSNSSFDYQNILDNSDNMTGYVSDSTTTFPITGNSVELVDGYSQDVLLYRVDQNKTTDNFKGCLGEIRIGGMLLPFFATETIYKKQYFDEYFDLNPETIPEIGCTLCYRSDCFNNGSCINSKETYKCNCLNGYAADDCSIDINECENNQCENNSTCVDLIGEYRCECLPGYEGENCQIDINECESSPCKHGGTCTDLIGAFKCECPEDFVGKQCEAPLLITCDNKPCKEGATCVTGHNELTGNNFTCHCNEGMEGIICDSPLCKKAEFCQNGYCNASIAVPFCQCNRGFEGKSCEININDCVSPTGLSPCQNGGICIDGINRYDCNCNGTGYTGLLCEMDLDECKANSTVCGKGICINMPGTYRCACDSKEKCGHFCSLTNPCETEHPCLNGECISKCFDEPDYICMCNDNYTGKNCTQLKVAASQSNDGLNILYIIIPIVLVILIGFAIGMAILVNVARSKRATRGTYSPSAQEFCNPRVELDHVLKPPPEERLI